VQRGILPATVTPDGYLIAVGDLGSAAAGTGQRSRPRGHAVTDVATSAATMAATDLATSVIVNPTARAQLEAIRDEWLAPLVAQITTQAARIGQLEAERAALQRRVEAAEAERDRLAAAQAVQDGPGAPERAEEAARGVWSRLRHWWRG